jgi:hypothetical protein
MRSLLLTTGLLYFRLFVQTSPYGNAVTFVRFCGTFLLFPRKFTSALAFCGKARPTDAIRQRRSMLKALNN